MPKYPKFYRFRKEGTTRMIALLSDNRIVSALSNKVRHLHQLETIVNSFEVATILRSRNLKQIKGSEFYNHYLKIRRSLNKQCISLIKSLNKVPL